MASLVNLSAEYMDSLKSILTSQDFGSEYEMLCTELSVQWLRIRLWGQTVGLHIDGAHHLQSSILGRPEIETIVTQIVNSIAFLLAEIEVLRRRYELRPRLIPEPNEDEKIRRDSKPDSGLFRPAKYLQQRMKDNQKQKSFLALAKWAVCDAKRFDEKVKRLKNLIDGLEDISKAAGITRFQPSPQNPTDQAPTPPNENPPPYSIEPPQQAQPIDGAAPIEQSFVHEPVLVTAIIGQNSSPDPELFQQYISLEWYAAPLQTKTPARLAAREKLSTLQDGQLKELRVDVYNELCRRRQTRAEPPSLHSVDLYHVKRNQARERLSALPWYRFAHLITDLVFELERRFLFWRIEQGTVANPSSSLPVSPVPSPDKILDMEWSFPVIRHSYVEDPRTRLFKRNKFSSRLTFAIIPTNICHYYAYRCSVCFSSIIFDLEFFSLSMDCPTHSIIPYCRSMVSMDLGIDLLHTLYGAI